MARKVSKNTNFNFYTGIAVLKVRKFNFTNEQYLKITGASLPYDVTYEENAESRKFPIRVLFELAKTNNDNDGVGQFVQGTVYIKKEKVTNKDNTKTLYTNKKGEYAYLENDGTIAENMAWFSLEGKREAYVGEKDLAELLKKISGFSKDDDWTKMNDLIVGLYKKYDVTKLNSFLNEVPEELTISYGECGITGLLTVSINAETGRKTQKVLISEGYVKGTDISPEMEINFGYKAIENIAKQIKSQEKSGYPIKDAYSINFQKLTEVAQETQEVDVEEETDDLPF